MPDWRHETVFSNLLWGSKGGEIQPLVYRDYLRADVKPCLRPPIWTKLNKINVKWK